MENGGLGGKKGQSGEWAKRIRVQTERATGLGIRTTGDLAKWDQTESPEIHTGGRQQKSLASLQGDSNQSMHNTYGNNGRTFDNCE